MKRQYVFGYVIHSYKGLSYVWYDEKDYMTCKPLQIFINMKQAYNYCKENKL